MKQYQKNLIFRSPERKETENNIWRNNSQHFSKCYRSYKSTKQSSPSKHPKKDSQVHYNQSDRTKWYRRNIIKTARGKKTSYVQGNKNLNYSQLIRNFVRLKKKKTKNYSNVFKYCKTQTQTKKLATINYYTQHTYLFKIKGKIKTPKISSWENCHQTCTPRHIKISSSGRNKMIPDGKR